MNFTLSAIASIATILVGIFWLVNRRVSWKAHVPIAIGIAATLVRIWLSLDARIIVEGSAGHDAYLFVWQAAHIIEGLWLGEYNYLTLIKGPFLGVWMALMFYAGIPFLVSLHALYVVCAMLMVLALRPVVQSGWAALGLYLMLVFNPLVYSVQVAAVVSRMGIYHSLTLGVAACAVALFLRRDRPLRGKLLWGIGLGFFLGGFLVTREAGVWIIPMLLVLGAGILLPRPRQGGTSRKGSTVAILVSVTLAAALVQAVCYMNWKYYGEWQVTEFGHPSFKAAYGALSRIQPEEYIDYVPVTRASREIAYSVSPAFSDLERHLEGPTGLGWANAGEQLVGLPAERREIAGGWFMWALREAAMWQEYHVWPSKAMAYYQQVADEINSACTEGTISCTRERATFAPVWRSGWGVKISRAVIEALDVAVGFRSYSSSGSLSAGHDWVITMFGEVTRTRTVPRAGEEGVYASVDRLYRYKQRQLDKLASKYQDLGPALSVLAMIVILGVLGVRARGRLVDDACTKSLVIIVAISSSLLSYLFLISLIHISSFDAIHPQYLFPAGSLLLTLIFLSLHAGGTMLANRQRLRELDL